MNVRRDARKNVRRYARMSKIISANIPDRMPE